jgi:AAA15 family ATPase/GTPase
VLLESMLVTLATLDVSVLFRRDHVWFVEKDRNQASALVSLSEFSPRKNEALERGFLLGRYGGIPFLSQTLGLKEIQNFLLALVTSLRG